MDDDRGSTNDSARDRDARESRDTAVARRQALSPTRGRRSTERPADRPATARRLGRHGRGGVAPPRAWALATRRPPERRSGAAPAAAASPAGWWGPPPCHPP